MLAALILGQALAYGPPPPQDCRCRCDCPPVQYEEVHLGADFFVGEGGVGPAFAPPVYGGGSVVILEGEGFGDGFARAGSSAFAAASASASARASASANVRVRIVPGRPPMKPGGGGHKGGGHGGRY